MIEIVFRKYIFFENEKKKSSTRNILDRYYIEKIKDDIILLKI